MVDDSNDIKTFVKIKGRLVGIDFGEKRIGVALSDETQQIAVAYKVLDNSNKEKLANEIQDIVNEFNGRGIVFGWPLNLNGEIGSSCGKVTDFIAFLSKKFVFKYAIWDERLSSAASEGFLLEANVSRKKRKNIIDKLAAAYILQGALDFLRGVRENA